MIQKYLNASSHVWILHRDHHMLDTHVQNSESLHAPPAKLEKRALRAGAAAHCFARSCDLIDFEYQFKLFGKIEKNVHVKQY